jgi:hypothetical protein
MFAFVIAPVFAAARHIAPARSRRCQASKKRFKQYPIGFFHIDIAEVHTEEGRLYLIVAAEYGEHDVEYHSSHCYPIGRR